MIMNKILYDDNWAENAMGLAGSLLNKVKEEQVRVEVIYEPDKVTMAVEPWKAYEMKCPYGKENLG